MNSARFEAIQALSTAIFHLADASLSTGGTMGRTSKVRVVGEIQSALDHLGLDSLSIEESPTQVAKTLTI
tara:strand:+ start:169 stop:378 length:210 start_codon:yes stop_codon:yes gene_type:complete